MKFSVLRFITRNMLYAAGLSLVFQAALHVDEPRKLPAAAEPDARLQADGKGWRLEKIIWASSTPVTVKGEPTELDPEINPIIVEHNRMAAKVMREMRVPVNDFYSLLASQLELARGDQFHWRPEAYKILAGKVTESVLRELDQ